MRILLTLISIFLSSQLVQAAPFYEEIDYKSSIVKYYHAGSQVKIKLRGLPYNTREVIVAGVNSGKRPKVFIVGKRKLQVDNSGAVEFTVELENLKPGSYNTQSALVSITLYSYYEKKLEIDEKAKLYIRPIICSDTGDEVCASLKIDCHKGHKNCEDKVEYRTFLNQCDMKKHGADMLHAGACHEDE